MSVISLLNQKGGCGKSSSVFHLSGVFSQMGRRVLLVDNDPQSSLSQGFFGPRILRHLDPVETVAEVYSGRDADPGQVIRPSGVAGVDILPGSEHTHVYNAKIPGASIGDWELQESLRYFLTEVRDSYDIILVDCPPNIYTCSIAALVASDFLILPLSPEDFGAQGIATVLREVEAVRGHSNPRLGLLGYLLTMVNLRLSVHQAYEQKLREIYGPTVFEATVPLAADFKEAIARRQPVSMFRPRSAAAKAMRSLAEEIERRVSAAPGAREVA